MDDYRLQAEKEKQCLYKHYTDKKGSFRLTIALEYITNGKEGRQTCSTIIFMETVRFHLLRRGHK